MDTSLSLEEIRRRNPIHFKKVFNHFYEELVIYANGYLFDKASSEDVVQEVFLHIWENTNAIHIKKSLKAYLYAMVRNKCLNVIKSVKITDHSNFVELNINLIPHSNTESLPVENKKMIYNHVLQIMDAMPVSMQEIFKMKFVNNYKYAEIADELGISVNTVKTQLKRAKFRINELVTSLLILFSFYQ